MVISRHHQLTTIDYRLRLECQIEVKSVPARGGRLQVRPPIGGKLVDVDVFLFGEVEQMAANE